MSNDINRRCETCPRAVAVVNDFAQILTPQNIATRLVPLCGPESAYYEESAVLTDDNGICIFRRPNFGASASVLRYVPEVPTATEAINISSDLRTGEIHYTILYFDNHESLGEFKCVQGQYI